MATSLTTSCGVPLTLIDGTDCIGDSRSIINTNIQNLGTALCTLSSINNTFNANDTNTIDLTWYSGTRTLIGDVKQDSIRYSNLASWQSLSASPTLSAEAVQPRVAKAWVCFNGEAGTYPNGIVALSGSYNIASVIRVSIGRYRVNFQTPMPDTNYCAIGTIGILGSPASPQGRGIFISSYYENRTTTSFGFHLEQVTDGAQLPSHSIDIVFF